ncbi:MAG TPA: bifunctional adenosylcobinamide kinase/adenosylcobinamide-phosphate guanylyltransferase [Bryobacteraceae bacterium]|nr:bifunctional adenosylcobinamide kinase/adenosylcobinamide-phosphate guanylyltransferase [Bryobacteraceae bacterium]
MSILLVGGGSRSGKSRHALQLARRYGPRRGFLATAHALDEEMRFRIDRHREERGDEFVTIEEPFDLAAAVHEAEERFDVLVVDCLTLWLSNVMLDGRGIESEGMLDAIASSPLPCVLVTNEVGCGIVPENALARRFRDCAGTLNRQAAERAIEAYWMIFGVPLRLK